MPRKSSRRNVLTAVGAGLTVGIAGCAGDDNGNGNGNGTGNGNGNGTGNGNGNGNGDDDVLPDTLRIGHPGPTRPTYAAPPYSHFLDEMEARGVTVEPVTFDGFGPMIAGMISEDVEIGYVTPPSLANAIAEGFPVSSFMELSQAFSQQVCTAPGIDSWDEIEGETFILHSPSSFSAMVGRSAVEANLGDPEAVEYQYIAGTPNRIAAIEAGEGVATTAFLAGVLDAEEEGIVQHFSNPNDDFDHMTLATWATLDENLDQNEAMHQEIVDVMLESYEDMYDRDIAELVEYIQTAPTDFPDYGEEVWSETLETAREDEMWNTDLSEHITDEKFQTSLELADRADLLEEMPDVDDLVDRRFL
ncbi:ABC transporter substrate-binding protein [Natrarchaeobius halalkaliphilus]|uniref:ABC transporter substrate-binding protein n=1 Tax=Natrarchaeobius halalkaliphilus TaxID=1679091 RepID=A0A3N6LJ76_9EURY|nr:ABC transporter substrate-binding protein [Natrarchaeobius halalkaliphilus]RQG87931.1 ABC transporter substrate-binding protein [Natrarchaeobius halalkaliphilus]